MSLVVDPRFEPRHLRSGFSVSASEDAPLTLSRDVIDFLRRKVAQTSQHFPKEGTFAEKYHNVHSLVVRVDHVRGRIFEIEPRPMGMGIVSAALPTLGTKLELVRSAAWKGLDIVVVASSTRVRCIDDLDAGLRILSLEEACGSDCLVLVRALPCEREFVTLAPRAIAPITHEWRKCYGVPLELWKDVSLREVQEALGKAKPFVIKSDGTRSEAVYFWSPGDNQEQFLEQVAPLHPRYLQEYIPHGECPYAHTVLDDSTEVPFCRLDRSFFLYNIHTEMWVHGGSCWIATPSPPVHGTEEMIMGPIQII